MACSAEITDCRRTGAKLVTHILASTVRSGLFGAILCTGVDGPLPVLAPFSPAAGLEAASLTDSAAQLVKPYRFTA